MIVVRSDIVGIVERVICIRVICIGLQEQHMRRILQLGCSCVPLAKTEIILRKRVGFGIDQALEAQACWRILAVSCADADAGIASSEAADLQEIALKRKLNEVLSGASYSIPQLVAIRIAEEFRAIQAQRLAIFDQIHIFGVVYHFRGFIADERAMDTEVVKAIIAGVVGRLLAQKQDFKHQIGVVVRLGNTG